MAAALRHAGRTEHATRCCGRTGRSGSHQAAVRGLPGRVASAWSGGGWQPSGQRCHRGMRHRQQCAPSRRRARTRRSETRRPDGVCSRSVIGAPLIEAHTPAAMDGSHFAPFIGDRHTEQGSLCVLGRRRSGRNCCAHPPPATRRPERSGVEWSGDQRDSVPRPPRRAAHRRPGPGQRQRYSPRCASFPIPRKYPAGQPTLYRVLPRSGSPERSAARFPSYPAGNICPAIMGRQR